MVGVNPVALPVDALPKRRQRTYHDVELDAVVRLVKERTADEQLLCHGVTFHLNSTTLGRITLAQQRGQNLHIPWRFLVEFWRYALVDHRGCLQSALSFMTIYPLATGEKPLLKTLISLDGDIIHQVCADCLDYPTLTLNLSAAHYWLIQQLVGRLTLGGKALVNRAAWGVSSLLTVGYGVSQGIEMLQGGWLLVQEMAIASLLLVTTKLATQGLLRFALPTLLRYGMQRVLAPEAQGIGAKLRKWLPRWGG
ncbi:hypothetical protein VB712_04980 [Spirulina sp. CCNP1310]|uniref:hypothetical protein n=1 Tax=Spirulina sp. CCNP1310 TaxID=3110249 RepID=UPI002B2218DF|nr:hypothetical protein [Spirulina sp. CCNP1310]MEA5418571.1 hypothetical protein [Spirulina sp. CCNP1310]